MKPARRRRGSIRTVTRALLALSATLLLSGMVVSLANAQQTPTPSAQGYRGTGQESFYTGDFADIAITIDAFWSAHFQTADVPYSSPGIVPLDQPRDTACGPHGPGSGALYCTRDATIYLSPFFLAEKDSTVGDYAPITVLAHEWGHHVQFLTNAPDPGGSAFELQADCLAGVYTQNAEAQGLLDPGDISEAVTISRDSGDPLGLPEEPGLRLHGTNDERITAFMRGYLNGLEACDLPLHGGQPARDETPTREDPVVDNPVVLTIPNTLPLDHAACFRSEDQDALTFDELVARLGGTDEARSHLENWGWRASTNRVFACDTPPDGETSSIDISLHLFADAASAQQAVDYFVGVRAEGSTLIAATPPAIGDHAAVLSGPTTNGKEFTLYVSQGPLLVRVTGVSSSGIPFSNVLTVAQSLLAMPLPEPQTSSTQDVEAYLPRTLPLGHAACFRVDGEGTLDFSALVERFPGVPDAASRLEDLGWQAGAYRQFGCDGPPTGHVGWVDIGVHQFRDGTSAAAAVPFFASSRALGTELETAPAPSIGESTSALAGPASNGTEYTLYMSTGSLLFRVTGVAPAGDPAPDVQQVMLGVLAGSLLVGQDESPPTQAPALPTATTIPTPIIIPTATALPTATVTPIPTPTVPPTLTPAPTATTLPTPTATVAPTATPMSLPTAAPQVVLTPETVEPTPHPTVTVAPSSTGCELVELYPGYPDYRGYVAGIDGPGEVACLDDLIAANPGFDKAAEDAANLAAARAIGLSGTPRDWTWENWMAIEAERGLPRICYSCLFQDPGPQEGGQRAAWDPADPRLQMGGYGTSQAIAGALARVGVDPGGNTEALFQSMFDPNDEDDLGADHVLRAYIGATWPGHHTAPEMLDAYDQLFAELLKPGVLFLELEYLWESMLAQGGYAPTPPGADIEDQLYMIRTGMEGRCAATSPDICQTQLSLYDQLETQFFVEVESAQLGADMSYAAWLRENYPDAF